MKADETNARRLIGLARAWGEYIRMLAASIVMRQGRIVSALKESR